MNIVDDTIMLNGYRYDKDTVELMAMAYTYGWTCTKQFEKFYKWDKPYEAANKEWEDCEAAFNLLKEKWGSEFHTNMQDYAIEFRRRGNT